MSALARKLAVNTSFYAAGRVAVSAAGVVATAMATRYLELDRFGELTAAVVYVSVVALICDLGLYVVTVREIARRPDRLRELLGNAFTLGLALAAVAIVVSLLLMLVLYPGEDRAPLRTAIVVLTAQLLFSAPSGVANAYLTYRQRAGPLALGSVAGSGVLVGAIAVIVAVDGGFLLVAAAYAAQTVVTGTLPLLVLARRALPLRLQVDRDLWRSLALAALPQAAVLLLTTLYFRLDTLLLSVWSTDGEVALYGVAFRVVEGLIVLPVMFMLTLFPELARQRRGGERLAELVRHAFSTLLVGAVPLAIVVAAFAGEIVRVIGGPAYDDAAVVLAVLMGAVALNFLVTVFFQTLVALGELQGLARTMAIVLLLNLALNGALIPAYGALGAAAALVACEVVALALVLRMVGRVTTAPPVFRPLRLAAAAAIAGAAAAWLGGPGLAGLPALLALAVGASAVVVLFAGALLLLRGVPDSLDMIAAPVQRRLGLRP